MTAGAAAERPRRCVVFGGSGTVGRALVAELARAGARVAFTYRQGREIAEELTRTHPGVTAVEVDLADPRAAAEAADGLARRLGGVDAFVHCAVRSSSLEPPAFEALEGVSLDGFAGVLAVNVTSAFAAARSLLPHFDRGGNVVLFGSVDGIKPVRSPVPYAVSKAALSGLALSLAKPLGERGVRVNLVAPGVLEAGASRTLPDDLRREYLKHCGLRRLGKVDEVAALAAWLALENTYVTGQTLVVDGGL
ncbi:SDR family NAD(P)-dependent oxidoreductase [Sorangium sp. So ce131]|uniref:SDR family NAD(P)-dependent oxidoreductase n=1 Tax=Sorangium sp. So ce131 TaxID=3133282 RepID=UPI003F5FC2C2